ncbi:MAG TPA: phosphoribosylformylglycinamidine cyclo-ligase [Syntrophorhabdaceae bacterium]|nr:phosphoribosylformylglycinamidine cyclo-ligase [Syntrophorhabdaceae bacterium]HQM82338.1 phosphoribosylformylglycinamidine cyclo-ligase [Syntrophorhabdaceae bacterium]
MKSLTYKDAGVDIHKADKLIDGIKSRIQKTFLPEVLNPIGGFGALTELPKGYDNPVLVSSTDGVGTKVKIAILSGKHDTVGIDLVGMSVNDILTLGAKPFFFLDYYACNSIEENVYKSVIAGICDGCEMAGCALIGGETAEMPSMYHEGEYDLAGFAVGIVEKERIIDGSRISENDSIIGLASNGLHSNGFSLVRKVFFDVRHFDIDAEIEGIKGKLYEELLKPTRIYVKPVLGTLESLDIKGMVHITGGGLPGNIKRIIPEGLCASIGHSQERIPDIFKLIMELGNIELQEMYSTFNMGVGFVLIVGKKDERAVIKTLSDLGETAFPMGAIEKSPDGERVHISFSAD